MARFNKFLRTKLVPLFYFDTFGNIAIASLIICSVSGIFLAIVFDVNSPYDSIAKILMISSSGTFIRNLHYWSAQIFLIFTFLHIWDHFNKKTEGKVKPGVWLRLTISISVVLFVMLSGFILKDDADSRQAFLILQNLIENIPFAGNIFSSTFLGSGENLQILYIHHIVTATIFIIIVTYEHSKIIWTKLSTFFYTLIYSVLLSLFLTPELHDSLSPVIKGPWYFLGLQELLHWTSNPIYSIIVLFLLTLLFYFLPKFSFERREFFKKGFIYLTLIYFTLTLFAYFFRGENWLLTFPWNNPKLNYFDTGLINFENKFPADTIKQFSYANNRLEGCLTCHSNISGFTDSHNPQAIGCTSCHAGNPFTFDKDKAHYQMILIPGNESNYNRSCGTINCHPAIVQRVPNSIMSTLSGMISVNKFVFEEDNSPDNPYHVKNLGNSAAESHLRNLCVSCHIGNEKTELGPITQLSRGGGCNACHLNYTNEAKSQLSLYTKNISKDTLPLLHPSLSLNITNDHCFGCHSRSGRISTNYEGWHETKLRPDNVEESDRYRILEDERVFEFVKADVHHVAGMDCIDCHNSYETMGDGNLYSHKEDQVKIECIDCHLTSAPQTANINSFDAESNKIIKLRKINFTGQKFLIGKKSGYPLINTFVDSLNNAKLVTKNRKKTLLLNPPANICTAGKAHKDLSCSSCHTSWVPQCIGCHTEYNPANRSFDLLINKEIKGEWIEHIGDFFAELPTLGVKTKKEVDGRETRVIDTFMPGMIMTLDKKNFKNNNSNTIFKRLFAPTFSHTINRESRDCKSCHNSSLALGYGRGKLNFIISGKTGRWQFIPKYAAIKYDGLPEDGWTGFLKERRDQSATRSNSRPFLIEEQKKILTVGSCLICHKQTSSLIINSLTHFDSLKQNLSPKCVLPDWN